MYETNSSKIVHQGRAFVVRVDEVVLPDNKGTANFDIVQHPGGVGMLPIDADDNVLMVSQYRPATGETLLEIPAGTREIGEDAAVTAHRELQEEVGMKAGSLVKLSAAYLAPGYSSELLHIYLATDLTPSQLPLDADETIEVVKIPFADLLAQVQRGEMRDGKTVMAVLLAAANR